MNISMKGYWKAIFLLAAFVKIIATKILEHIKEHLENLIDKEQVSSLDPVCLY